MFNWACPGCKQIHEYLGRLTTRATTTCPNEKVKSGQRKTSYKIWQYKVPDYLPSMVVETLPTPKTIKANGKITPTSILRVFRLMVTGKERIPGDQDKDLYCTDLIKELENIRRKYILKKRKKGRKLKRWNDI